MKNHSRIRKGTAGILLTVFFISFLMEGFAARVIQAFSDHDHDIQSVQTSHGIQLSLVHDYDQNHDHDHEGSDLALENPDMEDSHHATDLESVVENAPHADHDVTLPPREKSIPSIFITTSFGFQTVVAIFVSQSDLFPSRPTTLLPPVADHDSSTRLSRVRSIVFLV